MQKRTLVSKAVLERVLKQVSPGLHLLGTGLLYLVLARVSLYFVYAPLGVASIWPPSGLALAAFLFTRRRDWPALILVLFLANTSANLLSGNALPVSLAFAAANIAESLLVAWLLERWLGLSLPFESMLDVLCFFGLVGLGNMLTAVLGAGTAVFFFGGNFWQTWQGWWVADGLGIALLTPLLLAWSPILDKNGWRAWSETSLPRKIGRLLEGGLLLVCTLLISGYVFLLRQTSPLDVVLRSYLLYPLLSVSGMRFNRRYTSLLLLFASMVAVYGTLNGLGQFATAGQSPESSLITVQLYLSVLVFATYIFYGIGRQLKISAQRLALSEAGYRGVFENASIGIFQAQLEGSFLRANSKLAKILGYVSPQELLASVSDIGRQIFQNKASYLELVQASRDQADWVRIECIGKRKDGSQISMLVSLRHVKPGAGQAAMLEGFLEDVTESRRIEQALLETSQEFRSIVESSPTAMQLYQLVEDGELVLTGANPAADELFGITHQEFLGREMRAILPELANPEFVVMCAQVARGELGNQNLEIQSPAADLDGFFDVHVYETSPGFLILDFQDQSERKLAERLAQARLRLLEFGEQHSLDELLRATLDEAELLSGSQVGFYHFLEDDQLTLQLKSWSTATLASYCTAEGKGTHYPVSQAGVWADSVRERHPVIHNDYASLPHRKGLPEGHAVLVRELVVPVLRGDKVVAIMGMGNKPWNYHARDLQVVQELAELAWDLTARKLAEQALQKNELLLKDTQALAKIGGWEYDLPSKLTTWTREVYRIYGVPEDYNPNDFARAVGFFAPEDQQIINDAFQAAVMEGRSYDLEVRFVNAQGRPLWVRTRAEAVMQAGQVLKVTGTIMDISERKLAEIALRESEEQLRLAMDASEDGLWDWHPQENFTYFNRAYHVMLGYEAGQVPAGMSKWLDLVHPDDQELMNRTNADWLSGRIKNCEIELRMKTSEGGFKWVLSRGKVVKWDLDGSPLRIIGTHVDITERKQQQADQEQARLELEQQISDGEALQDLLVEQATHDPLTGLYNRRFMNDALKHVILRAERESSPVSLLLMDIDHFKIFNDTYGHALGDQVLVGLGSLLQVTIRESDIACRYGGEEFLVILPGASEENARQRAELIREQFSQVRSGPSKVSATLSIGVAVFPNHGLGVEDLLRAADQAMYLAKGSGRNCVRVFSGVTAGDD